MSSESKDSVGNDKEAMNRRLENINQDIDRMKRGGTKSQTKKTVVTSNKNIFIQTVTPNFGALTGGTVVRIAFSDPITEVTSVFQVTFVCNVIGVPPVVWSVTVPYNQLLENQIIQFTTPDLKTLLQQEHDIDTADLQRDVVAHIKIIDIVHSDTCFKPAQNAPVINIGDEKPEDILTYTYQWLSPLSRYDVEKVCTEVKSCSSQEASDLLFNALYRAFASGQLEQSKTLISVGSSLKDINIFDVLMRADPKSNKTPIQIGLHFSRHDFIKSMLDYLKKESDRLDEDETQEDLLTASEVDDETSDNSQSSGGKKAPRKRLGSLRSRQKNARPSIDSVFASPTGKQVPNLTADVLSDGSLTDREREDIITFTSDTIEGIPTIEEYEEASLNELEEFDEEDDDTANDDDTEELLPESDEDPLGIGDSLDPDMSENISLEGLLNDEVQRQTSRKSRALSIISLARREGVESVDQEQVAQAQRQAVDRKYDLDMWRERFNNPDLHQDPLLFPQIEETDMLSPRSDSPQASNSPPSMLGRKESFTVDKRSKVKDIKEGKKITFGEDEVLNSPKTQTPSAKAECNVVHQSNFFKTSVYFEIDDDKRMDFNEEALNMTHMYERRESSLPFHVRQCLRFMSGDVLVKTDLQSQFLTLLKQRKTHEAQSKSTTLPAIPYDVNSNHTFEVDMKSKPTPVQNTQVDSVSTISTHSGPHIEKIKAHESMHMDSHFVMNSFEATFPVSQQLKELGIESSSQDLLLSQFSWNDENLDARRKLLFEHCAINFGNFEDVKKSEQSGESKGYGLNDCLLEDVYITVSLMERQMVQNGKFRRISENFHYKRSAKGGLNAEELHKEQLSDSLKDSVLKGREGSMRIKVSRRSMRLLITPSTDFNNLHADDHTNKDSHTPLSPIQDEDDDSDEESRSFVVNGDDVVTHGKDDDTAEYSRAQRRAMFTVNSNGLDSSQPMSLQYENLFVLFKVYRKWVGEQAEALNDLYTRKEKCRDKDVKQVYAKAAKISESMPSTYSAFAWTAVPLVECFKTPTFKTKVKEVYLLPAKPGAMNDAFLMQMWMATHHAAANAGNASSGDEDSDEEVDLPPPPTVVDRIGTTIGSTILPTNQPVVITGVSNEAVIAAKKLKVINSCQFEFKMRRLNNLTSVPRPFMPHTNELVIKVDNKHLPVSVVSNMQFERQDKLILDLSNVCYVYPLAASISGKRDIKNIQIVCNLRERDDELLASGSHNLRCFHRPFCNNPHQLVRRAYSEVSYKTRTPEFTDEWRLKLPSKLDNHHLFFKIYEIEHKENNILKNAIQNPKDLKSLIGYAFIKLTADGKLEHGVRQINIYSKLPDKHYLTVTNQSTSTRGSTGQFVPIDGAFLKIEIVPTCISIPQGPAFGGSAANPFNDFIALMNKYERSLMGGIDAQTLQKATHNLHKIPEQLHVYAPMIFNYLLDLIDHPEVPMPTKVHALRITVMMVEKYRREYFAHVTSGYLKYHLQHGAHEQEHSRKSFLAHNLILTFQNMYSRQERASNGAIEEHLLRNGSAIFSMILKSMLLKQETAAIDKEEAFSSQFMTDLETFLCRVCVLQVLRRQLLFGIKRNRDDQQAQRASVRMANNSAELLAISNLVTGSPTTSQTNLMVTDSQHFSPSIGRLSRWLLSFNTTIASFFKYLFCMLDKADVMRLAVKYVEALSQQAQVLKTLISQVLPSSRNKDSHIQQATKSDVAALKPIRHMFVDMQLMFFQELFTYHNNFQLFLPRKVEEELKSLKSGIRDLDGHYMYSAFLDVITKCLTSDEKEVRMKAITMFRAIYQQLKSDVETTVENQKIDMNLAKKRLYDMHFEFVVKLLGVLSEWKANCDRERKQMTRELTDHKRKQQQNRVEMSIKKEQVQDLLTKQKRDQKKTGGEIRLNMEIRNLDIKQTQLDLLVDDGEVKLERANEQAREEKRQLLVCVVDILSNMDQRLLNEWIQVRKNNVAREVMVSPRRTPTTTGDEENETESEDLVRFCLCLQLCANAFEYRGNDALTSFYDGHYDKTQKALQKLQAEQELKLQRSASNRAVKNDAVRKRKDVSMKNFLSEVNQQRPQEPKKGIVNKITAFLPGGLGGRRPSVMDTRPTVGTPPSSATQALSALGGRANQSINNPSTPTNATHIRHQSSMSALDLDKMQYNVDRVLHEKAFSIEISFLVFKVLIQLVPEREQLTDEYNEDYDPDSDTEPLTLTPLIENIVRTLLNFLHTNQSDVVHSTVLCYMRYFMRWYHRILFHSDADLTVRHMEGKPEYGPVLCEAMMALCNSHLPSIRAYAAGALYLLIRFNFFLNGRAPQVMATLALSRTLNAHKPVGDRLYNAIEWMVKMSVHDFEKKQQKALDEIVSVSTPSTGGVNKFLSNLAQDVKRREHEKITELYSQFAREMEPLGQTLKNLLRDTIAVNETMLNRDPHKTEDLFYRISRLYIRIPELQFNWLQQLAQYHKQNQNYPEAAQCFYRIIALAFDQMRHSGNHSVLKFLPLERFYGLSDDIKPYVADVHDVVSFNRAKVQQTRSANILSRNTGITAAPGTSQFTERGIVDLLNTTIDLLELAEFYEHAIVLLEMLVPIYTRYDDLDKLSETHGRIQACMQMTAKTLKEKSRLHSVFYRIGLFGFGDDDEATDEASDINSPKSSDLTSEVSEELSPRAGSYGFIYKMPKLFKLPKMKTYVKEKYGEDVELILSTKKINVNDLVLTGDNRKRYVQLSGVKAYIPEEHYDSFANTLTHRNETQVTNLGSFINKEDDEKNVYLQKTSFEKTGLNISRFYFEVAFSKTGKKLDPTNPAEVYKKKTIITIKDHFPFVKTRSPIVTEQDIILTPIETAIENIMEQVAKLEEVTGAAMASVPHQTTQQTGVTVTDTSTPVGGRDSTSLLASFTSKGESETLSPQSQNAQINVGINAELVDLQTLQMVLQGSVSAGVNGGPSKIVEAFLRREERAKYKRQHLKFLNERCHAFLTLCERSLKFHGSWCKQSQKPFHAELEKGFANIKELFAKHLLPIDRHGNTIFSTATPSRTKLSKSTSKLDLVREVQKQLPVASPTQGNAKPRQRFNTLLMSIRMSNLIPDEATAPPTSQNTPDNTA
jgi:tetratricopeptide (TPR) repeat protein